MNKLLTKQVLAALLAVVLVIGMAPAAFASTAAVDYDTSVSNGYYNLLSVNKYNLAPGAIEKEMILNNADGTRRQIVHVFEVDAKNPNIEVIPGYYQIDKLDPENLSDSTYWSAKELTQTVAYYENTLGYNVVGAMNTALAYDSNAPYDFMVWEGKVLADPANHSGNAQTYLAIYKDGTAELRSRTEALDGNEWTVIAANFGWLVKDGELVSKTPERTTAAASRSMIGIKADGTLVFCQVDGRVSPTAVGLSNYEMGEMMLALGCVDAVNGDGGGSSTFVSKREGTDEHVMRSIPSDGSERPTINSVIIVSKAQATGIFDHATVSAAYDYIAPGASMAITASGVDAGGYPAEVPADVTWQLSDASMGTIENGVFTAGAAEGAVTVQMVYGGNVVGEKLVNIVHPAVFEFDAESTVIPYGKTIELGIIATYGSDNWDVCVNGVCNLALSDTTAATLVGTTLTASSDESKTGVNVTVTYANDTAKTDVLAVAFGKGSEIIFDFEDGDTHGFMGFDEAKQWSIDNGVNNSLVGSSPLAGQYSDETDSYVTLATAADGHPVRNGNHAMAWVVDNTNAAFAQWTYNVLFNVGESIVLRDVANGKNATRLGMWLYIPEGAAGLAFQSQLYAKNADGTLTCKQAHFTFTTTNGTVKNLNSCTEADIPESRWVYASIDLTAYDYICTPVATDTSNSRSPSIIRTYVKPVAPQVVTFYIDDITLDYSSAVDDRVLPTISNASYATQDTAIALADGASIDGNTMTFSANIADNAGLDYTTGKIYVDGVALDGVTASGKVMSSGEVTLTSGVHTVTFEIKDKLGNAAEKNYTVTVSGDALITLGGHNDSGAAAEYDSIYYVDINTADINAIDKITTTLKLQSANTWELDNMVAAPGFKASYVYNELTMLATITVERISTPVAATLSTEQTLVSIPVRVWSWDAINHITGQPIAPDAQFATGNNPIVTINCEVVEGNVTFAEGSYEGYNPTFGGEFSVATNLNDSVNLWHVHDAELTVLNQEATCTADGYENRTYCESCASVVDFGTTIPATGHSFAPMGNVLACQCGEAITGSGLVTVDGKLYCLIGDKLVSGWQAAGTGWCYADPTTYVVATGEYTVSGLTYTFDENGVLVKGAWVTDAKGTKYSYGPAFYTRVWKTIDGADYYFGTDGYIYTGIRRIPVNRNNLSEGYNWYDFGTDGKKVDDFADYDGIVTSEVDGMHYVKNGMSYYAGLVQIDGDYYYARTSGEIVCGRTYYTSKSNDLLPVASYEFGEDGKMINPPAPKPDPAKKNGVCADETGKLFYYFNDVKTYGGLLYLDTDGDGRKDAYYYSRTSGEIVCGRDYWVTKNNDILPTGRYTFGADGKMVNPPLNPNLKNGILADETGKLFYYVDDYKTYGGLLYLDTDGDGHKDAYYYARTSGEIVCGRKYYITKNNDLLPAASYEFGEDGKMINPPAVEPDPALKNGIFADESGKLFYYVDGVKFYGGLVQIDGDYYYARTSGEIVCGRDYWITKTNGLKDAGKYTFDADGKMIVK